MYWREYRAEFHVGLTHGISEAAACRTIQKIENALIKSEQFYLPSREGLQPGGMKSEIILVDVPGQPVERPEKNSRSTAVARKNATRKKLKRLSGRLQERSCPPPSAPEKNMISAVQKKWPAAACCQCVAKIHRNSQAPAKKTKLRPLNKEQKADSLTLARKRILIEISSADSKRSALLSERCRSRRKRFSLIAAVHDMELTIGCG